MRRGAYPLLISTEIFPTHIRGSGIGTTMTCGRITSIFAPMLFGALSAQYGIAVAFRLGALAWIFTIIGYLLSRETSGVELEQLDRGAPGQLCRPLSRRWSPFWSRGVARARSSSEVVSKDDRL
jgi:MFS family permease